MIITNNHDSRYFAEEYPEFLIEIETEEDCVEFDIQCLAWWLSKSEYFWGCKLIVFMRKDKKGFKAEITPNQGVRV